MSTVARLKSVGFVDRAAAIATRDLTVLRIGLWVILAANLVAGWGVQWDIQWHVTIGRDSFWIAPHLMTYAGVTAVGLASFGVLAWTTLRHALRGVADAGTIRIAGISGTRGYHVAAIGVGLTVLAAPVDDLWHRLFGIDVTIWSPPHLLGFLGGLVNSAACLLIAREVHPAGTRARLVATLLASGMVYGTLAITLQPAFRIGYLHGGIGFYTYPILAALVLPIGLLYAARLTGRRMAPLVMLALVALVGYLGSIIADAGFAWLQPVSVVHEVIADDPTSPIAVAQAIAKKNGTRPGGQSTRMPLVAATPVLVMVMIDPRRRPRAATLGYAITLFALVGVYLALSPAFKPVVPSVSSTAAAFVLMLAAALVGAVLGTWTSNRIRAVTALRNSQ